MVEQEWEVKLNLRTGIAIYPSHDKAIERVLSEFMKRCPAKFALLADSTGLFISTQGERVGTDLVALASLIAADLAANKEMAAVTGNSQSYQSILREGNEINTFISEAGRYLVLFIEVSTEVPLGWARLLIREVSRQLADIVTTPAEELEKLDLGLGDKNLSDLAGDALSSMWTD